MTIPSDYEERVYAGVLGKIIGVYLGRPIEGWSYERIASELGEITGYVNHRLGIPLVVTDDDITGTFTFFRALEDADFDPDLTAETIGRGWLNYIIEERTILWWGGLGHSTEHTAFLRLKDGIAAPRSGSADLNGRVVAEQIGSQIFIDAWAMATPGDPERAVAFARRAASVSHDGEAIHAAALLAAMESQAFVESDLDRLLDVGLSFIPRDSVIARLAADMREWRQVEPDWRVARLRLEENYGSGQFKGNVHIVPNHGLILLSLLWGDDDFSRTMSIVNTSGWDTDCNSGNAGCLMGIKNGLSGLAGPIDWRGPVADRLYLPTAEGGRAITDAVIEAGRISAAGRRLVGQEPVRPKDGARFHFSQPGSVQGFAAVTDGPGPAPTMTNIAPGDSLEERCLRIGFDHSAGGMTRATTSTFIPPEDIAMPGYRLLASPTLHPGQTIRASVHLDPATTTSVDVRLIVARYDAASRLVWLGGPVVALLPGGHATMDWLVPDTDGQPIAKVGIEVAGRSSGAILLDWLRWSGEPEGRLGRPTDGGVMWRRAWVDGMDIWNTWWDDPFRVSQNRGTGLLSQGSLDWADYRVEAVITPHLATAAGVAARVQGQRRWYALQLVDGEVRLVRCRDEVEVLARLPFAWEAYEPHRLVLEVVGDRLTGWADGALVGELEDGALRSGGVGLVLEEGTMLCDEIAVSAPAIGRRHLTAAASEKAGS